MSGEKIPTATPIAQFVPGLSTAKPMAAYGGAGSAQVAAGKGGQLEYILGDRNSLDEMLSGRTDLFMEQELELFEALAQQVGFGCVETRNKYVVYDFHTGERLLFFKEESPIFERCCCKPYHTANIYGYDVRENSPQPGQVLMQVYKPFRCGHLCACCEFCQPEATFFTPTSMDERAGPPNPQQAFGAAKVPQFGVIFTPTVNLMNRDRTQNVGKIEGPTLAYGGCLEFCTDQIFQLSVNRDGLMQKDGGVIKLKPKDLATQAREAVSDADKFRLTFPQNTSDDERASLVGTMVLLDYLFFETKGAIQFYPPGCTLCNLYCCGCSVPCHIECNGGDGGGGGE